MHPKEELTDAKSERLCEHYQQYREANQPVKCLKSADKQAYIDGLAAEEEDAAKRNQQGTAHKITKLTFGKYQAHANTIIKDKQGFLLMTEREHEE